MCSPIRDFTLYRLAFDCGDWGCWGERTIDLGAVTARRSRNTLVGHIMNRLRCVHCGRPPQTVFLETGARINVQLGVWRKVILQGSLLHRPLPEYLG